MATPHLQRLKPGQQPSAAEWNRLVDLVSRQGLATGTAFGDIGVAQGAGGIQILDGRDRGHWARIGARGTGAAYAHTHAAPDGDGTFTDLPQTSEYEWGTTTSAPAREVNGNEGVAEGTYAWVWPDPVGVSPGYLFEFSGGCGAWCGDWWTVDGRPWPLKPHQAAQTWAFSPGAGSTMGVLGVTDLRVVLPTGIGKVRVRGAIKLRHTTADPGITFSGSNGVRSFAAYAAVVFYAAGPSGYPLTEFVPVVSGTLVPTGVFTAGHIPEAWPDGWWTPVGDAPYPLGTLVGYGTGAPSAYGPSFTGVQHFDFTLDTDLYYGTLAFEVRGQKHEDGWPGTLDTVYGDNGTWLTYEPICSACEPDDPDDGEGSGSGSSTDVCCAEELARADLVVTADGDDYTLDGAVAGLWQAIDLSESVTFLRVACLSGTWYAWSTVDSVEYGPIEADSAACEPFSATFDGPALGFADPVTVEAA